MSDYRPHLQYPGIRYAGFWIRLAASLVDSIIVSAILIVVILVVGLIFGAAYGLSGGGSTASCMAAGVGGLTYLVVFVALIGLAIALPATYGWTLGMRAVGIRVTREGLDPRTDAGLGAGTATGRWFAALISGFVFYLGYLWIAFQPEKRAWHDLMAHTWVVHREPAPVPVAPPSGHLPGWTPQPSAGAPMTWPQPGTVAPPPPPPPGPPPPPAPAGWQPPSPPSAPPPPAGWQPPPPPPGPPPPSVPAPGGEVPSAPPPSPGEGPPAS